MADCGLFGVFAVSGCRNIKEESASKEQKLKRSKIF